MWVGLWLLYTALFPIGLCALGSCVPQHFFGRASPTTILCIGVFLNCVYCALIDEFLQALLTAYNLGSLGAREGDSVLTECAEDVGREFVECHSCRGVEGYAVRVTVMMRSVRLTLAE